jgi:hypothetical protein
MFEMGQFLAHPKNAAEGDRRNRGAGSKKTGKEKQEGTKKSP